MDGGGGGGGGRRRNSRPPSAGLEERDEDLLLFREMHKREKNPIISLLQPVSTEFEAIGAGNNAFYRMGSDKRGSGYEFVAESEKNDYDWLKTPPATPLFQSLEMEANAPELLVQREIPIIQPLSRFACNSEAAKPSNGRSKSPNAKPKVPLRSVTPSGRPSICTTEKKNARSAPVINQKMNQLSTDLMKKSNIACSTTSKPMNQKVSNKNFLASNLSKSMAMDSKTKPTTRGVSPLVRSTIPAQIPGFSGKTPPNLKTDRRQSCSPSVARGRKVEPKQEGEGNQSTPKAARLQSGNGTQILGSKMVDKFLNARKTSAEERETKLKLNGSLNESFGFGRILSKRSLDHKALKHTEVKRESANFCHQGTTAEENLQRYKHSSNLVLEL